MDCSMREASRKEHSTAPKEAFFGPIGTKKRAHIPYIRVFLVCQKWRDFFASQKKVFMLFF